MFHLLIVIFVVCDCVNIYLSVCELVRAGGPYKQVTSPSCIGEWWCDSISCVMPACSMKKGYHVLGLKADICSHKGQHAVSR